MLPFTIVQAYVAPPLAAGTEATRLAAFWHAAAGAVIVAERIGVTGYRRAACPVPRHSWRR